MKIKVLDLFSGKESVKKALQLIKNDNPNFEYEYIGIDIYGDVILDLSQNDIINKIKKITNNFKPDFIWASPLCIPFSTAASIKNGTLAYEWVDKDKRIFKVRENFKDIKHKQYQRVINDKEWIQKQINKGKMGLKLIENTIKIIKHYKVPFVIENPAFALSRYLLKDFKRYVTHYCMYGFNIKKPTAIYTYEKLKLLSCNHKKHNQNITMKMHSNRINRSLVPEKLIKNILLQIIKKSI